MPKIDYVSPTGDLSVITERFEAVFSSHVVEHQPDLVRHLNQVAAVLKPGGRYYILMPDMRYCFDALLAPTHITQVLAAHLEKRKVHTLESVLEHYVFTTHNDASRHWRGDSGDQFKARRTREMINAAFTTFKASKGGYVDVHAWKFTPDAFRLVTQRLNRLGFVAMAPEMIYETPQGRLEFAAILQRDDA